MTRVTGSAGCGPLKLMIVEDEALIAMSLEDILIELGHEVMCVAYTVEEAVSALDRPGPAPQAVILDANLGGRSARPWRIVSAPPASRSSLPPATARTMSGGSALASR